MNLESVIRQDLWEEISNSYNSRSYRNAIVEAMHFLTNVLRQKTETDLDGYKLVNEALGGKNPKLKINKFQTQSEIDEQEGFAQMIMGLYKGIRNPRSHEMIKDTQENADALIHFINYILEIVDSSKQAFTISAFLEQVFDPDFVEKPEYAEELLNDVPKKKMGELLIEIYRKRFEGNSKKLKIMVATLINRLDASDIDPFIAAVSSELQTVTRSEQIRTTLEILPADIWTKIKKTSKMRIENKLINSIKEGEVIINSQSLRDSNGALGTWASIGYVNLFTFKDDLKQVLLAKLKDADIEDNLYVINFFLYTLTDLFTTNTEIRTLAKAISRVIKAGETRLIDKIIGFTINCPENWREIISKELKDLTDEDAPRAYLPDGSPFLGKENLYEVKTTEDEGEIPF